MLDVEYDSNAHHLGSEKITADSIRRNELISLGITVIVVTRNQYNDMNQFDKLAKQIASKVGKQLRHDPKNLRKMQIELRKQLTGCS